MCITSAVSRARTYPTTQPLPPCAGEMDERSGCCFLRSASALASSFDFSLPASSFLSAAAAFTLVFFSTFAVSAATSSAADSVFAVSALAEALPEAASLASICER